MGTIADKLTYLNATKAAIKAAIVDKGVSVADTDTFRSYADKIASIETGGGDNKLPQLVDGTITELTAADLAGATKIRSYAFYSLLKLASVTIPDSITIIGGYVFYNCTLLSNITIGSGVTDIGSNTFQSCTSLKSITIPDSLKSITASLFYKCYALESVNIPNSITSIGAYAFEGCSSLTSITISDSVTSISSRALLIGSSTNKATITMKATTPPSIQSSTFTVDWINKIIVPAGTAATYKAATNWSNFADYIEEEALPQLETPQNVTADGTTLSFDEVENATSYDVYADETLIGNVAGSGTGTLSAIDVDLTTLDGWSALADGEYNVTVVAKADGYTDSEQSAGATVTKGETEDELAGTWVFNDSLNFDEGSWSYNLEFESNGTSCTTLEYEFSLSSLEAYVRYDGTDAYILSGDIASWTVEAFKTITITSTLAEVENGEELLAWLQNNAIKQ